MKYIIERYVFSVFKCVFGNIYINWIPISVVTQDMFDIIFTNHVNKGSYGKYQ